MKWLARTVLVTAIVLGVWAAVSPLMNFHAQRVEAKRLLRKTIQNVLAELPPPHHPINGDAMPKNAHAFLREGYRYYPQRDAYKYTFLPRYQYSGNGEVSRFNKVTIGLTEHYIPESLERRSLWFKAENGRWRCWAGVTGKVSSNLCNDRDIVAKLNKSEHETAYVNSNRCGDFEQWLSDWDNLSGVYRLENQHADKVWVDIGVSSGADVLILHSDHPHTEWYIQDLYHQYRDSIGQIVISGTGSAEVYHIADRSAPVMTVVDAQKSCPMPIQEHWQTILARLLKYAQAQGSEKTKNIVLTNHHTSIVDGLTQPVEVSRDRQYRVYYYRVHSVNSEAQREIAPQISQHIRVACTHPQGNHYRYEDCKSFFGMQEIPQYTGQPSYDTHEERIREYWLDIALPADILHQIGLIRWSDFWVLQQKEKD